MLGVPADGVAETYYAALFTVAPTDSTSGTEVSGGSYARVAIANNATNFPAASSGSKANGVAITFPTSTGSWGTVVAWGLFDASSGGNLCFYGSVSPNVAVGSGVAPSFPIGSLTITCD